MSPFIVTQFIYMPKMGEHAFFEEQGSGGPCCSNGFVLPYIKKSPSKLHSKVFRVKLEGGSTIDNHLIEEKVYLLFGPSTGSSHPATELQPPLLPP